MFPKEDAFPRCRTALLRRMLPAYFGLLRNAKEHSFARSVLEAPINLRRRIQCRKS